MLVFRFTLVPAPMQDNPTPVIDGGDMPWTMREVLGIHSIMQNAFQNPF